MSLLTITQLRQQRDQLTERELWQRCKDAARLEMRGSMYSPDDRQDCAAQIMADGLATTHGAPPRRDDPKHSLSAYCQRAKTIRRSVERHRARDLAATESEQDAAALSLDALMPDEQPIREVTHDEAMAAAREACRRIGFQTHDRSPIRALFYGYARDLPGATIAHELGMSPNAYDVACCRARTLVRAAYPSATDFLQALCGSPVWTIDRLTGEPTLRFALHDDSREAHDRTHALAVEWRTGTAAGSWPQRPESVEQARAACQVRFRRSASVTAAQRAARAHRKIAADQQQADALRRLGYALAA